jgi:putative restriction endonuclease
MSDHLKYFVGLTDAKWFNFLRAQPLTEVNFWRPGAAPFRALAPGSPFLFRLHAPRHFIVGGGFFLRYLRLPLPMAWKLFEFGNGTPDYNALVDRISHYRGESADSQSEIGCIVLTSPFFFDEDEWLPVPKEWIPVFGPGQGYRTNEHIAGKVWEELLSRLQGHDVRMKTINPGATQVAETLQRYGTAHLVRARLGQPGFRAVVTDAYRMRCAISGERTLPVLEAAHIRPYAKNGPHSLGNGLLLRADLHILFDQGFLTVTKDLRVEVSSKIKEKYENGRDYYVFHGSQLKNIPINPEECPTVEFLDWHNSELFKR